ncbi:MAG TPA: polysaccharide biosynthesis protein, partial [Syntrophothermus lipocalidus]|nr:polysaccharide biosynthesis protein [Syntrophothermus lipocalidus]
MVKKQNFLVGAFILAVAGAVSKALGAVYRIPLARLIGGEGMGLYQMAYPIYTTILALATAGVPVAISVLVARKETEGLRGDSRRIFRVSLVGLALLGLVLSIVVWQGAGFLARNILHEPRAVYPIMAIAPAIFFSGLMSVFRGYFQGYQWMVPTAVSQVVEQIFRVTFVLILAYLLFPRGLEYAAAGATFGAVVGGIAGLIFLLYSYIRFRRQMKRDSGVLPCSRESSVELGWQVVKLAVPISFGAVVVP